MKVTMAVAVTGAVRRCILKGLLRVAKKASMPCGSVPLFS